MKFIRYIFACWSFNRLSERLDLTSKFHAKKWNHLKAIKITKGAVKINWDVIFLREFQKCHRCLSKISKGEHKKGVFCQNCETFKPNKRRKCRATKRKAKRVRKNTKRGN